MTSEQMLQHAASDHRRAGRGLWRRGHVDGGDRSALVAHARPSRDAGAGRALHDRSQAHAARARSEAPRQRSRRHRLRRAAAGGDAMRWTPRGYGGERRPPEEHQARRLARAGCAGRRRQRRSALLARARIGPPAWRETLRQQAATAGGRTWMTGPSRWSRSAWSKPPP